MLSGCSVSVLCSYLPPLRWGDVPRRPWALEVVLGDMPEVLPVARGGVAEKEGEIRGRRGRLAIHTLYRVCQPLPSTFSTHFGGIGKQGAYLPTLQTENYVKGFPALW